MKNHILLAWVRWSASLFASSVLVLILVGCEEATESPSQALIDSEEEIVSANEGRAAEKEPPAEAKPQKISTQTSGSKEVVVDITAFGDAAMDGNIDFVRQAIKDGVDVNAVDDQQRSALMLAAFNGHTSIIKLLLDQGALLDHQDALGRTALMFAATGDNLATVKLLLDSGADVNAVDKGEGFTSLMHAAAEGQLEVVRLLLEHKANPAIRDVDGDSALDFAKRNGHSQVVELLAK
ncbi:ankyrin repeat domain-containing protein [Bythopirellula polymerisocia]|uniref:Ankyrin repeats (3 copies) n=1 Tax=Bythopirellula polymerisocia TaxID=2528003 RepID=A0A5C6CMA2_9BACT|nr:ankyrin repeat domain-containing protein [Bythopirellula polymerisocia]TWU25710.1 Ankyrin repeats (3 copies) [Bythopirellula polymerisocia]